MTETHGTTLRRNAMGVPEMVFLVIAFAAPLAASTTNIPMAIGLGNGVGAPGTWLVVGLLLVLFSVGYTAMAATSATPAPSTPTSRPGWAVGLASAPDTWRSSRTSRR